MRLLKLYGIFQADYEMNHRQIEALRYLIKNPNSSTSVTTYSRIFNVSRVTAGKDLKQLEKLGFLKSKKMGRDLPYFATDKVEKLIKGN